MQEKIVILNLSQHKKEGTKSEQNITLNIFSQII